MSSLSKESEKSKHALPWELFLSLLQSITFDCCCFSELGFHVMITNFFELTGRGYKKTPFIVFRILILSESENNMFVFRLKSIF